MYLPCFSLCFFQAFTYLYLNNFSRFQWSEPFLIIFPFPSKNLGDTTFQFLTQRQICQISYRIFRWTSFGPQSLFSTFLLVRGTSFAAITLVTRSSVGAGSAYYCSSEKREIPMLSRIYLLDLQPYRNAPCLANRLIDCFFSEHSWDGFRVLNHRRVLRLF